MVRISAQHAGDSASMPGSAGSPGEGNRYPLQYSCLDRIPWTEEPGGRATGKNEVRHMAGFKTNAELSPSSTDTWFDHMEIYVQ